MTKKKPKRLLVELTPPQARMIKSFCQTILDRKCKRIRSAEIEALTASNIVRAIKWAEKRSKYVCMYGDGEPTCEDCPDQHRLYGVAEPEK